jgi:hypothetical protein
MKGQVSIEVISGVIITLVAFALILFYSYQQNLNIDSIENSIELRTECQEIADIISSVYASGKKTTIEFYSENDFNVGNGFIDVNGFFCNYYGIAQEKFVGKGNVRIKDLNGVVEIENF